MAKVNWSNIKNQYEIMHDSVEDLARANDISIAMINLAVKDGGWTRLDLDNVDTSSSSERLSALADRHQGTLTVRFIELQAKLLQKCDEILDEVNTINDANNLKIVADVVEKHRPHIMGAKKDGANDNSLNIKILTQIGSASKPDIAAVQITGSAGASNGVGAIEMMN